MQIKEAGFIIPYLFLKCKMKNAKCKFLSEDLVLRFTFFILHFTFSVYHIFITLISVPPAANFHKNFNYEKEAGLINMHNAVLCYVFFCTTN